MELIDLEPQDTHGGSMRYIISRKDAMPISKKVEDILRNEKDSGLTSQATYFDFKKNCESYRFKLITLLENIKDKGKSIAGYAATSKSTTITNYCGITSKHINSIYDTTPIKIGKFSPGTHIPIKSHNEFKNNYPDYALLFGYNHSKEIFAKEQEFVEKGGKWITYVPEVKIV
jgi:methylation protein EvaC